MASSRVVRVRRGDDTVAAHELEEGITQIQAELKVTPDFPEDVVTAAKQAAAEPRLPQRDRTDMAFVTIDPPGAMDLDQALFIERDGDGFVVHYAIADLAAFITPGDPVDQEAHERGDTLYGADSKVPLHPTELSEDAASLLPDQVRPAFVWSIKVDETGEGNDVIVERALVKSRERLDYEGVQRQIDAGTASESLMLLREGRQAPDRARGRPRRRLVAAARAGGRHRGQPLATHVPLAAARRAVERPDLVADRVRGRLAHGLRPGGAAADASAGRPP